MYVTLCSALYYAPYIVFCIVPFCSVLVTYCIVYCIVYHVLCFTLHLQTGVKSPDEEEEAEEDEEELGVAETYADYMPSKGK